MANLNPAAAVYPFESSVQQNYAIANEQNNLNFIYQINPGVTGTTYIPSLSCVKNGLLLPTGSATQQSVILPSPQALLHQLGMTGYNVPVSLTFPVINLNAASSGSITFTGVAPSVSSIIPVGPSVQNVVVSLNPQAPYGPGTGTIAIAL